MKTTKQIDVCDFCQEHECYEECLGCGKSVCWECREQKKLAVKYTHAVYVSGSGDGLYCNECDARLTDDPLHKAYVAVAGFKDEYKAACEELEQRRKRVELRLKVLLDQSAASRS